MPTYYVEDYDGPRDDEPAAEVKVVSETKVEDKAVKSADSTTKRTARKK